MKKGGSERVENFGRDVIDGCSRRLQPYPC